MLTKHQLLEIEKEVENLKRNTTDKKLLKKYETILIGVRQTLKDNY